MFVKDSKYEHQKAIEKGKSSNRAYFMNFSLPEIRTFFLLEDVMNKKTTALTTEQYREIITTMKEGGITYNIFRTIEK